MTLRQKIEKLRQVLSRRRRAWREWWADPGAAKLEELREELQTADEALAEFTRGMPRELRRVEAGFPDYDLATGEEDQGVGRLLEALEKGDASTAREILGRLRATQQRVWHRLSSEVVSADAAMAGMAPEEPAGASDEPWWEEAGEAEAWEEAGSPEEPHFESDAADGGWEGAGEPAAAAGLPMATPSRLGARQPPAAAAAPAPSAAAAAPAPAAAHGDDRDAHGGDGGGAPPGGPAAPALVETRRTPHLEAETDVPVVPDTTFDVVVWADQEAARPGERSEDLVIRDRPDVTRFEVEVWLDPSPHFEVVETPGEPLVIDRSRESSERLRFRVRVRGADELRAMAESGELVSPRHGWIRAVFYHAHRPSGRVDRRLEIALEEPVPEAVREPRDQRSPSASRDTLVVDATARRPDLLLHVLRDEDEPDRRFSCRLETPHLDLPLEERTGRWVLGGSTAEIVTGFMAQFTEAGADATERLAALRGAGRELFEASPTVFKKVWWKLVDAGHRPATIGIVTEEPFIPWELMIPHRRHPQSGRLEILEPLGVGAAVGRFVHQDSISGRQTIPLRDSHLVAPAYEGRRKLEHAEEEIQFIASIFQGTPVRPVTVANLESRLAENPASLIHFACHGKQTGGVSQAIYLDDEKTLTSIQVSGMFDLIEPFERSRPLVFLNACEVGRLVPALFGVEGFAEAFLELQASAVVAPLWSVKDRVAHEVAMKFYEELRDHPETPLAEILRRLRARAYSGEEAGEDSYAAYSFYGDPLAVRA